jgi:hypothetical protein
VSHYLVVLRLQFFYVVKRSEVKNPLYLIVMGFLGVFEMKLMRVKTVQVSKHKRLICSLDLI